MPVHGEPASTAGQYAAAVVSLYIVDDIAIRDLDTSQSIDQS